MATEIKLAGVKKSFRMGEVDVPVLRGIDMEIYAGELTVVLGASGSGKSTLLNMIGGVDRPTAGEIWFEDRDITKLDDRRLTEFRRVSVGFIFQFYNLIGTLTAKENVQVATEIVSASMDPVQALDLVGLKEMAEHFPAQLSGGQQQRVAIARALAKNPKILLCDEPTGALDAKTGQKVLQLLTDLNEKLGMAMIIITHAAQIARLAHRVVRIDSGTIEKTEVNEERLAVEDIDW